MKMTRIKYMTIFIAVLVGLIAVFSYVNFGYSKGLEMSDGVIEYPVDNPDLNMPDGNQIQNTGNGEPYNPNNPYVFIDIEGNMHKLNHLPDGTKDEYDKATNTLIKTTDYVIFNDVSSVYYGGIPFDSGIQIRFSYQFIRQQLAEGVYYNLYSNLSNIRSSIGINAIYYKSGASGSDTSFRFSVSFDLISSFDNDGVKLYVQSLLDDMSYIDFVYYITPQIIQGRPERAYITYEEYLAEKVAEEKQKHDRITYTYDTFILSRDYSFGVEVTPDWGGTYWTGLSLLEEKDSPYNYQNPFIYPVVITGSVYAEYPERWPGDFLCVHYSDGTKDNINMTNTGNFNFTSQSNKKIVDIILYNNNRIGGTLSNLKIALFNPAYGEGYLDGETVGYDAGHDDGYNVGKVDGYTQGAQETLATANVALSFFPQIFASVGAFFVDTLGGITLFGISMWDIVVTLAIVLIVGIIIKFIS